MANRKLAKRKRSKKRLRKFWVEVEDNTVTRYLLAAPNEEAAKEIVEDLDMESVKKLAMATEVKSSKFGVTDVTERPDE